jgi:hypothetical protein
VVTAGACDISAARDGAIAACLRAAGAAADVALADPRKAGEGWYVLMAGSVDGAGGASIACVVTEVAGVSCPVAIAIMTGVLEPGDQPASLRLAANQITSR